MRLTLQGRQREGDRQAGGHAGGRHHGGQHHEHRLAHRHGDREGEGLELGAGEGRLARGVRFGVDHAAEPGGPDRFRRQHRHHRQALGKAIALEAA